MANMKTVSLVDAEIQSALAGPVAEIADLRKTVRTLLLAAGELVARVDTLRRDVDYLLRETAGGQKANP